MSSKSGDKVRWNGVKGIESGTILDYLGDNEWLVSLSDGKCVIVNEKSFING